MEVEDMGPRTRDPQIWAWLMKDGKHLMSMSKVGILRLWDICTEKVVASMDVMGNPLCWDYTMDDKGITMIVNVETRNRLVPVPKTPLFRALAPAHRYSSEQETFRVWRYNWAEHEPRLLLKKLLGGDIRSNWIEGDLAGCVGILDDALLYIYVADWVTLKEAFIETQLSVSRIPIQKNGAISFFFFRILQLPSNLSAATSPDMLFIYAEDTEHAVYFAYTLSALSNVLTDPIETRFLFPNVEQDLQFQPDGVDSLNFWIPTCRVLWDGRTTGVFSRSMRMAPAPEDFTADYVTLSTVELVRNAENGEIMEKHQDGTVRRHVAHWFDPHRAELLVAPADWDVCAMGTFAKTAVWMERTRAVDDEEGAPPPGRIKVCFADFLGEGGVGGDGHAGGGGGAERSRASEELSGSVGPSGGGDSNLEMGDPRGGGEGEATMTITTTEESGVPDWWGSLGAAVAERILDEEIGIGDIPEMDHVESPSASRAGSEEASSSAGRAVGGSQDALNLLPPLLEAEEPEDVMPGHSVLDRDVSTIDVQLPVSFGHFCEYELEEDWERRYGRVYTVDFDDARGVVAFATGRGKVVLLEFL